MLHDISVPELSPILVRKKSLREEIMALNVATFNTPPLPMKDGDDIAEIFSYDGYDIITLKKMIERKYTIPTVQTSQEVISYYAKQISVELRLPSQFNAIAPKVKEFLRTKAFVSNVDLEDPLIVKAISDKVVQHVTVKTFVKELRKNIVEERTPHLVNEERRLSGVPGFPWSRHVLKADKTVFNLAAVDNKFEKRFALFLEMATDVRSFAKLPAKFHFFIPYTDTSGSLRYYEPDFVVVTDDGIHHIVETKGREDVDVRHKDHAANRWCENATLLTEKQWKYIKVPQREYEKLGPDSFSDLIALT